MTDGEFRGQTAWVVGGSGAIGAAIYDVRFRPEADISR
jgi:hypothetical protein